MTNKNRTHSTREKTSRKIVYTPPNNLDAPDPKVDGIKNTNNMWTTTTTFGDYPFAYIYTQK